MSARPGRHGGVADTLPSDLARAVLDAGVLMYPVHDEQRRADRVRLQRDIDAHSARQARYAAAGSAR